jgi:hypothetical protein
MAKYASASISQVLFQTCSERIPFDRDFPDDWRLATIVNLLANIMLSTDAIMDGLERHSRQRR